MSEIGSGSGTSFPTALDTDNTTEVASPNTGKTKITAARANDVGAAIVATETEIGIRGAATADVRSTINLEHVATGAHTTAAPVNVTKAAASSGTGTTVSRADHKHDVTTAAPATAIQPDAAAAEGAATSLSRSDHLHAIAADVPVALATGAVGEGVSTSFARADHQHGTPTTIPLGSLDATAANSGYPQSGTGGETLRIIRGNVSSTGSIDDGAGFTITKGSTGFYTINFTAAFGGVPAVSITARGGGDQSGTIAPNTSGNTLSATACPVRLRSAATATDIDFSFLAIGPA
jgi:hypothetical protein